MSPREVIADLPASGGRGSDGLGATFRPASSNHHYRNAVSLEDSILSGGVVELADDDAFHHAVSAVWSF